MLSGVCGSYRAGFFFKKISKSFNQVSHGYSQELQYKTHKKTNNKFLYWETNWLNTEFVLE